MKNLLYCLALLLPFGGMPPAHAAELVMVDSRACVYCMRFHREVGKTYGKTTAGQVAPLRKVSRLKKWPSDLAGVTPVFYTPVFILVDNGEEIGRFPGYTTPDKFWSQLKPLLAKLDEAPAIAEAPPVAGASSLARSALPKSGAGLW